MASAGWFASLATISQAGSAASITIATGELRAAAAGRQWGDEKDQKKGGSS